MKTRIAPILLLAALGTVCPVRATAPAPASEAYQLAQVAFRDGRFAEAYGRFARLADQHHAPSAEAALWMYRQGGQAFRAQWHASAPQLRRWQLLVIQHARDQFAWAADGTEDR